MPRKQEQPEHIKGNSQEASQEGSFSFLPMANDEDEADDWDEQIAKPPQNRSAEGKDQKLNAKNDGDDATDDETKGCEYFHRVSYLIYTTLSRRRGRIFPKPG